jgi:hypothetical protein
MATAMIFLDLRRHVAVSHVTESGIRFAEVTVRDHRCDGGI